VCVPVCVYVCVCGCDIGTSIIMLPGHEALLLHRQKIRNILIQYLSLMHFSGFKDYNPFQNLLLNLCIRVR
jgi:hypothetical protein